MHIYTHTITCIPNDGEKDGRVFPFSQVGWLGARRAQGLEQGVLPFPGAASGGCATDSELAQRWGRTQCSARSKHGTILGEKS